MAYTLNYLGGTVVIADGDSGTVGNVTLPGRNFSGYGSPVDQNFVSLAENFASSLTGPTQPLQGQVWYDASNANVTLRGLKFNSNSVTSNTFTPIWNKIATISDNGNLTVANLTVTGTAIITTLTTGATGNPGTIIGQWTLPSGSTLEATYADLAERHHSDQPYPVGTVMTVGGNNEVTAASIDSKVLGVVSDNYAYLMNAEAGTAETHPAVAYVGRVPVRIIGPVHKHEVVSPSGNGCAQASHSNTFGWALETNTDTAEKLVLCIIK